MAQLLRVLLAIAAFCMTCGDTVNTASRMESTGTPGETQVTEKTYDLLKDVYNFEKLPPIDVKGKGIMQTFKLINKIDVPKLDA